MAVPRFIKKQFTSEIAHVVQMSASGQVVPAGGTLTHGSDFNLTLAGFLNPFNLALPGTNTQICGGHVIYVFFRVGAGATASVTAELHANHAAGGGFRLVVLNMFAAAVTAGNAAVSRFADAGAAWELRVIFRNGGVDDAVGCDYAIAVRAF